jgi:site-specific DNA-methyltransferase (adenine-specific)
MSLPAPYYDHGGITIYHADCRHILPFLGRFDLLLTDPPYGMDYQSAWRTDHQRKPKIVGDLEFPTWITDHRGTVASFYFCRWDNLSELPKPKSFIAWDKCKHSMGDLDHEFGRQWEAIAFYPGERHEFQRRPADIIRIPCVPACRLEHPNEKPVDLIARLIAIHDVQTILDPFAGSGTTGRAAKDLGKQCTMIELDERYCEIAARRLAQDVLPMFAPDIPPP